MVVTESLRTVTYMRNNAATGNGGSNGAFFRVVLLVHREKYDEALEYVERARKCLATELAALHIRTYLRELLSLISELWSSFSLPAANRPVHGPPGKILHLVDQLCLALNDEFRRYLPIILLSGDGKTPHYMKVDRDKWAHEDDDAGMVLFADLDMGGMDFSSGPDIDMTTEDTWGVNYQALQDLFELTEARMDVIKYEVGVQMIEIYNEQVKDLLIKVRFDFQFGVSPKILDPVYLGHEFPLPLHLAESESTQTCEIHAHKGDRVKVHYRGKLTDGTVFDSSFERGGPIEFEFGTGQVIKGWDQGLLGMCVGEKRKLKIPSKLGYRDQGSPPTIPVLNICIWFQGLLKENANASKYWAYRGDFEDTPNDLNFCLTGLVWPDRTPHPAVNETMYKNYFIELIMMRSFVYLFSEVKYCYQPIKILFTNGVIKITNTNIFQTT
ncbi:unnamed protein product [Lactuca saligna]|uniref:peptidylprolyl isomerase n=1 Tax=Lactuca saligna TaxID=75948 RepID=A0AA35Z4V4_LACSI|nr:unnamed protein product [Lactuca saligna]